MDEQERIAAIDAYSRGELEVAGSYVGLTPVAIKYGHSFDETEESYRIRLCAALGLPEPVQTDTPEGAAGHPGEAEAASGEPGAPAETPSEEQEDNPEPEDEEDPEDEEHPPGHPSRRKRRRR